MELTKELMKHPPSQPKHPLGFWAYYPTMTPIKLSFIYAPHLHDFVMQTGRLPTKEEWEKIVKSNLRRISKIERVLEKNKYYPTGLSKAEISNYYKKIAPRMVPYLEGFDLMISIKTDEGEIIRRHKPDGGPYRVESEEDLTNLTKGGRVVSIHYIVPKKTDMFWVDIDPGDEFPLDEVRNVTTKVFRLLERELDPREINVKFSGSRGFHIFGRLTRKEDVDDTRERLKEILRPLTEENPLLTLGVKKSPKECRLDVSTLKDQGTLLAPYSINIKTGLVSLPISVNRVRTFDFEEAKIYEVADITKEAAKGIHRAIYRHLKRAVERGLSFDEAAKYVAEKVPGWKLRREDYKEMQEIVKQGKLSVSICPTCFRKYFGKGECPYCLRLFFSPKGQAKSPSFFDTPRDLGTEKNVPWPSTLWFPKGHETHWTIMSQRKIETLEDVLRYIRELKEKFYAGEIELEEEEEGEQVIFAYRRRKRREPPIYLTEIEGLVESGQAHKAFMLWSNLKPILLKFVPEDFYKQIHDILWQEWIRQGLKELKEKKPSVEKPRPKTEEEIRQEQEAAKAKRILDLLFKKPEEVEEKPEETTEPKPEITEEPKQE